MATQIGPRIGIEGEAEYRRQIQGIIQTTKTLGTEMKALTASFDKDNKSIKQNAEQRQKLNQMLKTQQDLLKKQEQMMLDSSMATDKNGQRTDALREKTEKWKQVVNNTQAEINRLQQELKNLPTTLDMVGQKFQDVGRKMTDVGKTMTRYVTAPIMAGFGASLKAAIDWESAFTGVMKTVDETATTSYDDIAKGLTDIAKTTASSRGEIAGVAEVAGQLGIGADSVVEFTKTMVMLGDTTNLTAEEAATSLARIMNITGDSADSIDRLGSVIVDLGNNMATSESEIVAMSNRLAASGKLAGLSTPEIMALSAAMTSVGIQAEAGGTAMTQTLTKIESEVASFASGADSNLGKIAEIAGMTGEQFASAWEDRPIEAIQAFIKGLGELDEKGESATMVLDELGMSGIRQSNMLKSLALASDTLGSSIEIANNAYSENSALGAEAAKRYQTMEAQLNQLKESFVELAVQIGEILMPYLKSFVDKAKEIATWLSQLNPETQKTVVAFAAMAAAIGPLMTVFGKLVDNIGGFLIKKPKMISLFGKLSTAFKDIGGFAGIFAKIGPVLSKASVPLAIISGLVIIVARNFDQLKEHAINTFGPIGDKIGELASKIQTALAPAFETIKPIFEGIKTVLSTIWTTIETTVVQVLMNIMTFIGTTIGSIIDIISGMISVVTGLLTGDWQSAWDGVLTVFDGVKTGLAGLGTFITETLTAIVTAAGNLIVGIVGAITSGVGSVISAATNLGSQMFATIGNFFKSIAESAKKLMTDIASGILAGISFVVSAITNLGQRMLYTLAQFVASFAQKGREMIQGLGNAIVSGASAVVSQMYSVGSNIVQGVMNGFGNAIGSFRDYVTNAFSNVVSSVKSGLGISSPSKVFAEIGKFMGMGLEQGWDRELRNFNPMADLQMRVPTVDSITGIGGTTRNYSFTNNITMNGDYRERDGYNVAMSIDRWLGTRV